MTKLPVVGQAYTMPSLDLDAQNCINWFVVKDETGKFVVSLFPSPGHTLFSAETTTQYSGRGAITINGKSYVVIDNVLYQLFSTGERKKLGNLNTSVGPVVIIANKNQLLISDRFNGYVYQILKTDDYDAGEFEQITKTSAVIADPTFTGSGLDDMDTEGTYTGTNNRTYKVEVQTAGTPDKIRWSDTDGETWNVENIDIIVGPITLNEGVQIEFNNTTGHTAKDYWEFDVTTDSTFYPPIVPTYVLGYGVLPQQNTNRFFVTAIDDFRKINALDFAFAEGKPHNLVASASVRGELWLFTDKTAEVWYLVSGGTFPLLPRSNYLKKYGCIAPYSLATLGDSILAWLGTNEDGKRCFLMMELSQPIPISTEALDTELKTYETVDDVIHQVYYYQGQTFIAWTFPTEDKTWVYSLKTKSWHERLTRVLNTPPRANEYRMGRWSASCSFVLGGKQLVCDSKSGNIYELDSKSYTENDGTAIILERTMQHMQSDLNRLFFEWLILDFEAGVGLTSDTDQGHQPEVMLLISKDGGHSWIERNWKGMGKKGQRRYRAKWNKFGYARVWTFRIRISDPVYRVLLGCVGETEVSEE